MVKYLDGSQPNNCTTTLVNIPCTEIKFRVNNSIVVRKYHNTIRIKFDVITYQVMLQMFDFERERGFFGFII